MSRSATRDQYSDEPALLPAREAWSRMAAALAPVAETEAVPLDRAVGRVLSAPQRSRVDVPAHTNSAVDGYAFDGRSLDAASDTVTLRVNGRATAGVPWPGSAGEAECVRIMTGAVMPAGTDTVVMQEHVRFDEGCVTLDPRSHRRGQNVRLAGEDLAAGAVALEAGTRLLPAHLGLLASLGLGDAPVYRPLRVAFASTGDELRSAGEALADGAVYDANRFMLHGLLARLHVTPKDLGIVRDDEAAMRAALLDAARSHDVVITSGGASTGEADYVRSLLAELGEVGFWRVAIRPGRPLAFGRIGGATFFGLPGNPIAVLVTFMQFVAPALRRLMGEHDATPPPRLRARLAERVRKKAEREEYYRAVLSRDASGETWVRQTGKSGSGLLHTMTDAECFIVLDHDAPAPESGEYVDVQPFHGLL